MSSSQLPFALKRAAKPQEKSNFAHTCNLLSQYVKEKGSLKGLNLVGLAAKMEATGKSSEKISTMNLLTNVGQCSTQQSTPVDSLPQFVSAVPEQEATETKRSQMTIFYEGKVLVFDDLPADKAIEVMQLASNSSSAGDLVRAENYSTTDVLPSSCKAQQPVVSVQEKPHPTANALASSSRAPAPTISTQEKPHSQPPATALPSSSRASPPTVSVQEEPHPPASAMASCSIAAPPLVSLPERPHPSPEANTSELPIARRSSLHRFLEKRKDRAAARGPYHHQAQNAAQPSSSSKNEEQLELKL